MRVLGIDASLRNTGVAIVDGNNGKPRALYYGTIHNKAALTSSSCLVAIRDRLAELIHEHEPESCALESVIYVQSYAQPSSSAPRAGRPFLAAAEKGLPVFEYAPEANQAGDCRSGRRGQKPGGLHGARASRPDGNPGCRRGRCARDWTDAFARAGKCSAHGLPGPTQI